MKVPGPARWLIPALVAVCGAGLTGCATIIHGTSQKIQVSSTPAGANILIDGGDTGQVTPAEVTVKRDSFHTLSLKKDGYQVEFRKLDGEPSGAFYWNFLLLGTTCAVDWATGGMWTVSPSTVQVGLRPQP